MGFIMLFLLGILVYSPNTFFILLILYCIYICFRNPRTLLVILPFIIYKIGKSEQTKAKNQPRQVIIPNPGSDKFVSTKEIRDKIYVPDYGVYIDAVNKKLMVADLSSEWHGIYRFDEILECTVIKNGKVLYSTKEERYSPISKAGSEVSYSTIQSMIVKIVTVRGFCEIPVIGSPTNIYSDSYKKGSQFAYNVFCEVKGIINSTRQG